MALDSRYCALDCNEPPCGSGNQSNTACIPRPTNESESGCSFIYGSTLSRCQSSCGKYQCAVCNSKPIKTAMSVGPLRVDDATVLGADITAKYFDNWGEYSAKFSCRMGLFEPGIHLLLY